MLSPRSVLVDAWDKQLEVGFIYHGKLRRGEIDYVNLEKNLVTLKVVGDPEKTHAQFHIEEVKDLEIFTDVDELVKTLANIRDTLDEIVCQNKDSKYYEHPDGLDNLVIDIDEVLDKYNYTPHLV